MQPPEEQAAIPAVVADAVEAAPIAQQGAVLNDPAPQKKRPGRPRKEIVNIPVEMHGIVAEPSMPDSVIETVYCNPKLFKKVFNLYKSYEVSELIMSFNHEGIEIYGKDHQGKSDVYSTIDGSKLAWYYCREPIEVPVKRETLERIVSTLDKNHYKITFLSKENWRSTLYVICKDYELDDDGNYEVEVINRPAINRNEARPDDTNYPVKFVLSSKHFKKKINDIKKFSPVFCIQKNGDEPLQFTFDNARKVNYNGVYKSSNKIKLQSQIAADDLFSVSVNIEYIKPFSNANIGENVYIAAHKYEKLSLMTFLDKKDDGYVCTIRVYTETKDYRRNRAAVAAAVQIIDPVNAM